MTVHAIQLLAELEELRGDMADVICNPDDYNASGVKGPLCILATASHPHVDGHFAELHLRLVGHKLELAPKFFVVVCQPLQQGHLLDDLQLSPRLLVLVVRLVALLLFGELLCHLLTRGRVPERYPGHLQRKSASLKRIPKWQSAKSFCQTCQCSVALLTAHWDSNNSLWHEHERSCAQHKREQRPTILVSAFLGKVSCVAASYTWHSHEAGLPPLDSPRL